MINYPLIISDFDGTLVKADGTISQYTKNTINNYIKNGGKFCICTGRTLPSIMKRLKELGLNGLVSCYQGALIYDTEKDEYVVDGGLEKDEAIEICEYFEGMHYHTHIYSANEFYSNTEDELLKVYEDISGCKANGIVESVTEKVKKADYTIRKVLVMCMPEEQETVYNKAVEKFGKKYGIVRSTTVTVEVISKKYSKGTAIECMAKIYGVPIEKTISVGDAENDIPMIISAGKGIAVKNADQLLKDVANEVFDYTNEEDAIAKIIEKYGYTGE